MNNQSINMNDIINLVNVLQIQNKQLLDENNNLKSIINSFNNSQINTFNNIDSTTNDDKLVETNSVQENTSQENLDTIETLDKKNDKYIVYYYPSKNKNYSPFEYKFYIQDNAKYSIRNDLRIRGKHIKINYESNSVTASYFNNKKLDYINLFSKEFYELNPNISKNVEIFRNKNKKRFDKYDQDPDL
jgi:hypothetical protein